MAPNTPIIPGNPIRTWQLQYHVDYDVMTGQVTAVGATQVALLPCGGGLRYPASMSGRAGDWFRHAEADLRHARNAMRDGDHDWSCFAAHQAAEKAAKAADGAVGQAWGHVVTELLEALRPHEPGIDDALLDRARALDKLYVPTRYPNGLAGGAPTDLYTRSEAERAIADAEAGIEVCRRVLSRK